MSSKCNVNYQVKVNRRSLKISGRNVAMASIQRMKTEEIYQVALIEIRQEHIYKAASRIWHTDDAATIGGHNSYDQGLDRIMAMTSFQRMKTIEENKVALPEVRLETAFPIRYQDTVATMEGHKPYGEELSSHVESHVRSIVSVPVKTSTKAAKEIAETSNTSMHCLKTKHRDDKFKRFQFNFNDHIYLSLKRIRLEMWCFFVSQINIRIACERAGNVCLKYCTYPCKEMLIFQKRMASHSDIDLSYIETLSNIFFRRSVPSLTECDSFDSSLIVHDDGTSIINMCQNELLKNLKCYQSSSKQDLTVSFDATRGWYCVLCPKNDSAICFRYLTLTDLKILTYVSPFRVVVSFVNGFTTILTLHGGVPISDTQFVPRRITSKHFKSFELKTFTSTEVQLIPHSINTCNSSLSHKELEREENGGISLKAQKHVNGRCTIVLNDELLPSRPNQKIQTVKFKASDNKVSYFEKERRDDIDDTKAALRRNTQPPSISSFIRKEEYTVAPVFGKENDSQCERDASGTTRNYTGTAGSQEASSSPSSSSSNYRSPVEYTNPVADCGQTNGTEGLFGASGGSGDLRVDGNTSISRRKGPDFDTQSSQASVETCVSVLEENTSETVQSPRDSRDTVLPNPGVDPDEIRRFEPLIHIIDKIADGERVPPQITMRYEMLRFCTLRSYPKDNKPYITRLAAAGFYYANDGDEVVCYTCAKRKRNWQENDVPMDVHRQINPNCKFLNRNSEVNVPIRDSLQISQRPNAHTDRSNSQSSSPQNIQHVATSPNTRSQNEIPMSRNIGAQTSIHSERTSQNTDNASSPNETSSESLPRRAQCNFLHTEESSTANQRIQYQSSTVTSNSMAFPNNDLVGQSQNSNGTGGNANPKYPTYCDQIVRETSFVNCNDIVLRPESLAEVGFFHTGFGDCVRCFHCGVGLRHWSADDDPWIEHSRWSKDCAFVRRMKGQEFVNLVQLAVQYAQNQNREQESQEELASSTNRGTNGGNEIDNLMHTDSAQSVLEMGYDPNLIHRAIRRVLDDNGRPALSASSIMGKIFEIEEEETPTESAQNQEEQVGSNQQSSSSPVVQSHANAASASDDGNVTNTARNRDGQQSLSRQENTGIPKASTRAEGASPLENRSGSGGLNDTRKAQLREQKKLKEENTKLKQQSICTKCKKNDVSIVFLPCGHLITCEDCAPTVKYCSMVSCGKYIKGTVRTYLA